MAGHAPDRRSLLRNEGSDISEASTAIDSPVVKSPPHHRHTYHRMASNGSFNSQHASIHAISEVDEADEAAEGPVRGLGIENVTTGIKASPTPIARVPVGAERSSVGTSPMQLGSSKAFSTISFDSKSSPQTPGSGKPLLPSPAWARFDDGIYTHGGEADPQQNIQEQDISKGNISTFSEDLGPTPPGYRGTQTPKTSISSINDNDQYGAYAPPCTTKNDIHTGRSSWLSVSIMCLSVYSTVFSGIWLMLALVRPRYGKAIHSGGNLTPATASIVFALFAKTIELSFVTVFVTFLGQVLSRRSLVKTSRGITIAEMSMRTWVIQPGFIITHWSHLQHVGVTMLGGITLLAALIAMFYTTASDALVSPHLKFGKWEYREMSGWVETSYANPYFIKDNCQTPVTTLMDPDNAGLTCLAIEHAGQAYHNFLVYMDTWATISALGVGESSDISQRPAPVGMLFDNTTVVGSWVYPNASNITANYEKYNRIINNVTVSMPHANVFSAARDPKNGVLQPAELAGVGEYILQASVVSPTINVLCVNMMEEELAPLTYVTWPNAQYSTTTLLPGQRTAWSGYQDEVQVLPGQTYLNSTVVDDIFEWGPAYGRQPPVFPMVPIDYNSLTNISVASSDSIYILAKAPASTTTNYTLCQMRSFLSPNCSTRYNVSGTVGGNLASHCDDPTDPMAYWKSVADPPITPSTDWRNVISEWALSLSLNTGVSNANSSTSRLLSQFITAEPSYGSAKLNGLMPSIAEALSVLSGCTLLLSTTSSTFYHYWAFDATTLNPGVYQNFNASISSQQYTSGYTQNWQAVFYLVLLLVFSMNVFCLTYFFLRSGLVTDFTEPPNLFALAINSPPAQRLSGSCGAGPEGDQLNVDFHVGMDEHSNHVYIKEGGISQASRNYEMRRRRQMQNFRSETSYSKLSNKRRSWL
ncbi:hypothetical protein BP6252_02430 [Coleophoma cylindrospora]|uniref:Mcm2 3 5 family protein n=1 Tax=Coleophoma cylindrospora TaxID=1849047 RepID=A0A3D8SES0_9HELO|nr:hypothetical protein BP6252_02430 [Coleophoma cylindrospora]